MSIYFTADTHFGHTNIIKYCNRPYASTEEHDAALINNWNFVVGAKDIVFHLGDFAFFKNKYDFVETIHCLNGTINFVWGNHDKQLKKYLDYIKTNCADKFNILGDYYRIKAKTFGWEQDIILMHYAMRVWDKSHHGSWHLYGHSHGTLPDDPHARSIDVGVDCHNYCLIEFNEIKKIMDKKLWQPIDHHGTHEAGKIDLSKLCAPRTQNI